MEPADEAHGVTPSEPAAGPPAAPGTTQPATVPPRRRRQPARYGRRRSDTRALATAFQADAIEIEQRQPPFGARAALYLLLLLIVITVAWAAFARVDQIVSARGKLVTVAPTIVVQPLETSIIREFAVRAGQIVHKGDLLARLDPTFTQSDVGQIGAKLESYAAVIKRLEAEVAGRPFTARDAGNTPEARLQESLYQKRLANYQAKLSSFDEDMARLRASMVNSQKEIALLRGRLNTLEEVENIRSQLYSRQTGSKLNLLDARNSRQQVQHDLEAVTGKAREATFELARVQADREAFIQDWKRQAAEELANTQREYNTTESQMEKATKRFDMVSMFAPADAVVQEVAQRSVGSVVREAEPLFTLVPLDVPLEVEASIDARDIALIRPGADVRIKLDAFPFQKNGTLKGVLRNVSEDTFSDEKKANPDKSFYRARIQVTDKTLRDVPPDTRFVPGMAATAEIKAGERTVLSYFLYPIVRGLDESIREP